MLVLGTLSTAMHQMPPGGLLAAQQAVRSNETLLIGWRTDISRPNADGNEHGNMRVIHTVWRGEENQGQSALLKLMMTNP